MKTNYYGAAVRAALARNRMLQSDIWRKLKWASSHTSNIINKRQEYVYPKDRLAIASCFADKADRIELHKAYCADQCAGPDTEELREHILAFESGSGAKFKSPMQGVRLDDDAREAIGALARAVGADDDARDVVIAMAKWLKPFTPNSTKA